MKPTFASITEESQASIYLVTLETLRGRAWYFMKIDRAKLPLFKGALKAETIDLGKYGWVLESGYGEQPPAEVKQKYTVH